MLFSIDPADDRPLYVQVMDEIRRARVTGVLRADDALPSVRQLAGELRVNPMTVQQAYRELEREGLVYVRRGQGTFVAAGAGSLTAEARATLARSAAARALRDAHRSGQSLDELIAALREAAADGGAAGPAPGPSAGNGNGDGAETPTSRRK